LAVQLAVGSNWNDDDGGGAGAGGWGVARWCWKLLDNLLVLFLLLVDNDWATTAAANEFKLALFDWLLAPPFCCKDKLRAAAILFNARFVPIWSRPFVLEFEFKYVWSLFKKINKI